MLAFIGCHPSCSGKHAKHICEGHHLVVAMEMVPDHDEVIARLAQVLPAAAWIALVGMREPSGWPEWLVQIGSMLMRPFGVRPEYHDIKPWTSVSAHLDDVAYAEDMAGVLYTARGQVPAGG